MVSIEPKKSTAGEKRPHLLSAVVENIAMPIGVVSFFWIGMLIEVGPVKKDEAMFIVGKVRGYPIKDHTYLILVKLID
jgi:hypothetical protein